MMNILWFLLLLYPNNFGLKFVQNQVSNGWNVVVVNVVDVVFVVVDVAIVIVVDPRNQPLKFGWNQVKNSGDIADIEFAVVGGGGDGGGGVKSFSCQTQLLLC